MTSQRFRTKSKMVIFIPKTAHERVKKPFAVTAIATLAGGAGRSRFDYGFIYAALRSMWSGMPLKIEATSKLRIWVRLPDLPTELWKPNNFRLIAGFMGAGFAESDAYTKEIAIIGYARIQIEVPLGFHPVLEVKLGFEEVRKGVAAGDPLAKEHEEDEWKHVKITKRSQC
ncbi:uncharacterized protein LOC126410627 [Nymphaea colorata]|uniref:uncharacterized protein LOC126410627 n=1 Tax=Nymphaea colorata TaxID=210225 RepID=UPI00214EAF5F|nr:uncharacterized protein LOC126410627 [Nymphaea colorata]